MTAFEIIEAIPEFDGVGVVELAQHLDKAQSTVHDHLSTLVSMGYVKKEGTEYRLGLKFLQHGIAARNSIDFFDVAQPEIDLLADKTGEVAWLYTEENGRGVAIYRATGERAMETIGRIGWRPFLHSTSAGKAMLAWMPEKRVEEIIERHGLDKQTQNTITTVDGLFEELESVRELGYAINDEENNDGILAIGAPIKVEERGIGAVSLSGPAHRFSSDETFDAAKEALLATTNQIELRLRYDRT